jgi:glycosyltransferase involved in cell wall biosynthesis
MSSQANDNSHTGIAHVADQRDTSRFKLPKVSVIVPNYNHAKYLPERLESIFSQTCQDFELIILDDCSTDDSKRVIEEFSHDSRVVTCFNESNSGCVFRQWNKGLDLASGELIWIAESDDYSDPEFLETMVTLLDSQPDVGIAFCCSHRVADGKVTLPLERWFKEFHASYVSDFVANGREYVASQMLFLNTIPNASSAVFRRALALKTGPADDSYLLSGDWDYWIRLLLHADLGYVARPLNYYRYHESTARHAHSKNGVMLEEGIRIALKVMENVNVSKESSELIRERLVSWYIDVRTNHSSEIPASRLRNVDHLAGQLHKHARWRFLAYRFGLLWLWFGIRRRMLDVAGFVKKVFR